jgi:hypothetical protein
MQSLIFAENIAICRPCCHVRTDGSVFYGYGYLVKYAWSGPFCIKTKYWISLLEVRLVPESEDGIIAGFRNIVRR